MGTSLHGGRFVSGFPLLRPLQGDLTVAGTLREPASVPLSRQGSGTVGRAAAAPVVVITGAPGRAIPCLYD